MEGRMKTFEAKVFDLWMDKFIAHPEDFSREWELVNRHLAATRLGGGALTYGDVAAEFFEKLKVEVSDQRGEFPHKWPPAPDPPIPDDDPLKKGMA
jgi:hypothetical protein